MPAALSTPAAVLNDSPITDGIAAPVGSACEAAGEVGGMTKPCGTTGLEESAGGGPDTVSVTPPALRITEPAGGFWARTRPAGPTPPASPTPTPVTPAAATACRAASRDSPISEGTLLTSPVGGVKGTGSGLKDSDAAP